MREILGGFTGIASRSACGQLTSSIAANQCATRCFRGYPIYFVEVKGGSDSRRNGSSPAIMALERRCRAIGKHSLRITSSERLGPNKCSFAEFADGIEKIHFAAQAVYREGNFD
jgi:hypothetical protein